MPKRKAKPDPRCAEQPAVAAILKLVHRPRGATVGEIAKARGLQPHTVRSILSRLGSKAGSNSSGPRSSAERGPFIGRLPRGPQADEIDRREAQVQHQRLQQ